jgi:F-type H+-transporting ATPase subunit alpha
MSFKNIDQFSTIIKAKIAKYANQAAVTEEGKVISVGDGIANVVGLDNVMLNELVEFENGTYGMALNLETDMVGVVLLGDFDNITENSPVKRTKKVISVPVGDQMLGRIVNPLGIAIDGKTPIKVTKTMPIEKIAPGVMTRQSVDQPLETGILSIDSMFPIGKGQRELIIGDRQTGKSTVAVDTIINQKGKNVYCVYVGIGQKNSSIAQLVRTLNVKGAMDYTVVVSATASDIPALKYIAPYTGVTLAEE